MTQIYLIHHGIAEEHTEYIDDTARPSTKTEQEKIIRVAQRFKAIGVRFDVTLTSPLVRDFQTAEIFQEVELNHIIEVFQLLAPGGDIKTGVS